MVLLKKVSIMVLALLLSLSVSQAANQTVNIRDITLRYCNGTGEVTKSLAITTKPKQKEALCLEFANEGSVGAKIGVNFVDGTLTADIEQKKACLPEGTKNQFGQYVTGFDQYVVVPARSKKRVLATLEFPEGYAGASYGCVTYTIADDIGQTIDNDGQIFTVLARVGSFVDAFVDGKVYPKLVMSPVQGDWFKDEGDNITFVIYRDGWNYRMRGNIYNTGNVAVSGTIQVGWSSRGGLISSSVTYKNQQVLPRQSNIVDVKVPWYMVWIWGMNMESHLNVDYKPILLGTHHQLDTTKTYTLTTHNDKRFFPWIIVYTLILILLLISILKILKSSSAKKPIPNKRIRKSTRKPSKKIVSST